MRAFTHGSHVSSKRYHAPELRNWKNLSPLNTIFNLYECAGKKNRPIGLLRPDSYTNLLARFISLYPDFWQGTTIFNGTNTLKYDFVAEIILVKYFLLPKVDIRNGRYLQVD